MSRPQIILEAKYNEYCTKVTEICCNEASKGNADISLDIPMLKKIGLNPTDSNLNAFANFLRTKNYQAEVKQIKIGSPFDMNDTNFSYQTVLNVSWI